MIVSQTTGAAPAPLIGHELAFIKMEGTGNDFIIFPEPPPAGVDLAALAVRLCDRHFGIGADGLLIRRPTATADAFMQIINSDGSEARMCGNGIRCLARFLYEEADDPRRLDWTIETQAGLIRPRILLKNGLFAGVEVDMGPPRFAPAAIPVTGIAGEAAIGVTLTVYGQEFTVTLISMGNPHCVLFVDDLDAVPFTQLGPLIENHEVFPDGANVEFVQVLSPDRVLVKVWERGAGPTLACGTGACAVGIAGYLTGLTDSSVTVQLPGGLLEVSWPDPSGHVFLSGAAQRVFSGRVEV